MAPVLHKMANKDQLIKSWMENYPEAGAGNCMKCVKFDYAKMQFTFWDEEEEKEYQLNLANLKKGLNIFLKVIQEGKYHNSMGNIPNPLAEGYEDDAQDHDALVQCALLGEVRYG